MRELQEILRRVGEMPDGEEAILATVVDVQGSGYRLAGARMLIDREGNSIGTVSGGCLEADVIERAKRVLANSEPTVIPYDTTKDDNSVFGLGMGCRGVVRILLEPAKGNESLNFVRECLERRERAAVATLISKTNGIEMRLASRFYTRRNGTSKNSFDMQDWSLSEFLPCLADDAALVLDNDRSQWKIYDTPHGDLEFFHEVINPPTSILIFGAGHDAPPLASIAKQMGWRVSVVDHRPAWATEERFPGADEVIVSRTEDLAEEVFSDVESVGVVMSHNYESDCEALYRLLTSSCCYIGALGPKKRTDNLLNDLRADGRDFDEARLSVLYSPVGLDIGASTPEGIALSIVAEIQAVQSGRQGGFLRDRQGSIYDR